MAAVAAGVTHALALANSGSPFIARQPVSTYAYSGATAFLTAGIVGAPPLSFQWQMNGLDISGATNATLTLSGPQKNNTDVFTVVVTNLLGTANSGGASMPVVDSAPTTLSNLPTRRSYWELMPCFRLRCTGFAADEFSVAIERNEHRRGDHRRLEPGERQRRQCGQLSSGGLAMPSAQR